MTKHFFFIILSSTVLLSILFGDTQARADDHHAAYGEETMLMFVGEDIEALTIASRREESAWQAPAVAQVIGRDELIEHGFTTLSEALAIMPGFHMSQKEWGTTSYLRGISNSTLFLYDTVPLGADSNKSFQQLDYNLSLAPIKRIEIVRGPGSVLWGPDAFAGIVNVVPLSGRDLNGIETGVANNFHDNGESFYLNMGKGDAFWDGFLSISGRNGREDDRNADLVSFWGDNLWRPVLPEERYGNDKPGKSGYLEATGLLSFHDQIRISGRMSTDHHPYAISDNINGTWLEQRDTNSYFLKLEANQPLGTTSSLRFTGFYNSLRPEYEIIDRDFNVEEKTSYGELIYDRSFLAGSGLFTGGISFREKRISDAPLWFSYFPDFLSPNNENLLPIVFEENYSDSLWSGFGQYSHQQGNIKTWLGLRYDEHDNYEDNLSFNGGIGYSFSTDVMMKLLYGTAYRTPSSRQLFSEKKPKQEKIETLEVQLAYNPGQKTSFSLVAFTSCIKDHVKEDPYAQLSQPNKQDIYGVEIEGAYSFSDQFSIAGNLTLLANNGPDETYHLLTGIFIRPDGSFEYIFEDIKSPYDIGPKTMFNMTPTWRPLDSLTVLADLKYFSERDLINARTGNTVTADDVWLLDVSATLTDLFSSGVDLTCTAKNIFDTNYKTPGTYEIIDGKPFTLQLMLQKKW